MLIKTDFSLEHYNTFGVNCLANQFCVIKSLNEIQELFESKNLKGKKLLILGEGSNILFTKHYEGLVLYNQIIGKKVIKEDNDSVYLSVKGGENWSELVEYTIEKGWSGLENLSLIPGTVGAAPVQNIGAYGAELRDVLVEVEAFDMEDGKFRIFSNEDCAFGYRDSVFKSKFRGRYFITTVFLKLSKKPMLNISYTPLQKRFGDRNFKELSIKEVSEAVKEIRRSKLPDPKEIGNAGSFFKNPLVSFSKVKELVADYPEIPFYKVDDETYKVAAGWLIEKTGWKGKRVGEAGVHVKQALVLVNYGKATGTQIYNLSEEVRNSVISKFGIELEREVTVI